MSGVWFLAGATAVGLILVGASVLRCLARSRRWRASLDTRITVRDAKRHSQPWPGLGDPKKFDPCQDSARMVL